MEWIIGVVILFVVIGAIFKPRRCDICHIYFKKNITPGKLRGRNNIFAPTVMVKCNVELVPKNLKVDLDKSSYSLLRI